MKKLLSLFLFTFEIATVTWAQSMTDEQVVNYVKTATQAGKPQQQIMKELAAKGVTRAQAERIKKRYEEQQITTPGIEAIEKNRMRQTANISDSTVIESIDISNDRTRILEQGEGNEDVLKVFGRNIFNSKNLTFAPSQNIATPLNYKLGPGDEIIIDVWGDSQTTIRQTISPDGSINIQDLGPVYLNGMTIKEADNYLRRELSKIYSSIDNDNSKSDIIVS